MGPLFFLGGGKTGGAVAPEGQRGVGGKGKAGEERRGGKTGARSRPRNSGGGRRERRERGEKKREAAGNLGDCWRLLLPMGLRRKGG